MFDKHGPVDIVIWIFCTALLSAGWSLMAMRLVGDMVLRQPMTISRYRRREAHIAFAWIALILAAIPMFTVRWLVIGYSANSLGSSMQRQPVVLQVLVGFLMLAPIVSFVFYWFRFGSFRKTGTFSKRIQPAAFVVWLLSAKHLCDLIAFHPW
jgi:hypothetical protein